jgi:hypothetical protein
MTTFSDNDGVTIFDGQSRLKLICVGEPEFGYPATAYPTRIEVQSGPFSVSVIASAENYSIFRRSLEKLHETLAGEVRLVFWNEEHSITFVGQGSGDLVVTIKITDSRPLGARLTVPLFLNQSYLPQIITDIAHFFPER